jgi:hypothetical protein
LIFRPNLDPVDRSGTLPDHFSEISAKKNLTNLNQLLNYFY